MKSKLTSCMLVMLLMGCQKSADKQNSALIESAAPPPAASPAAAVAAVASSDVSASAIPVEEDFEQKAEATVTASTVNQELDKLEKEIGR